MLTCYENVLWLFVCLFVVCKLRIKMSTLRSKERGCGKVVSLAFFFCLLADESMWNTKCIRMGGKKKEATSEQEKKALQRQRIESPIRVFWRHI